MRGLLRQDRSESINDFSVRDTLGVGHLKQMVVVLDLAENALLFEGALKEFQPQQGFYWEN